MKKRYLVLLSIGIMSAAWLLSSCSHKTEYEPSNVEIDEKFSSFLSVSVEEADSNSGAFVLENCCDRVLLYGDRNFLEKKIDGIWNSVVEYNQREMTEPSYELEPKESAAYETEWDMLDEGEYRYVIQFYVIGSEDIDPQQAYNSAVSFTI